MIRKASVSNPFGRWSSTVLERSTQGRRLLGGAADSRERQDESARVLLCVESSG